MKSVCLYVREYGTEVHNAFRVYAMIESIREINQISAKYAYDFRARSKKWLWCGEQWRWRARKFVSFARNFNTSYRIRN